MTTPPSGQGQLSAGWTTMDTRDRAQEYIVQLDSQRNLNGAEQAIQTLIKLLQLAPGQRVLEVGSGTGEFARELAAAVGPTGSVTGIDLSSAMVAAAAERSAGTGLSLTFQVGDASQLPFPDHSFDRTCAFLVLVHVEEPVRVLQEMVRVTKPGGRIVIGEPDTGTRVFLGPDVQTTRAVTDALARGWRNGWIARQMLRRFRDAGLTDLVVELAPPVTSTSLATVMGRVRYREAIDRAIQEGTLDAEQVSVWWNALEQADRDGTFFWAASLVNTAGRRP